MPVTADTLAALARYDTPTICNVIELFDVRPRTHGYLNAGVRCAFPELPPLVGFAATATFRADTPADGDAYASLEAQVEAFADLPGPAAVVIEDLNGPAVGAVFGEVMCSAYRAFGAAGLVTNGAGRDLAQVRALRFPVFTGGAVCAHGYCRLIDLGRPVDVGGVTVRQGDLLHGDANGVTTVPLDIADAVPDAAAEFVKAEAIALDYLTMDAPKSVGEFRDRHAASETAIAQLRARLRA